MSCAGLLVMLAVVFLSKSYNPDIVRLPSTVSLPCAELPEHTVIGHPLSVRSERTEPSPGKRKLPGRSAFARHREQLSYEIVGPALARSVHDGVAVLPGHHDVIRTHAVGHVIPAERGGCGKPFRDTARCRHTVNLGIAVVLPGKGNTLPLRRKPCEHLISGIGSQPPGYPPGRRDGEQVAGIGEHHLVAIHRREAQQSRFLLRGGICGGEHQKHNKQGRRADGHGFPFPVVRYADVLCTFGGGILRWRISGEGMLRGLWHGGTCATVPQASRQSYFFRICTSAVSEVLASPKTIMVFFP